ncbi:hypothetical protein N0V83_004742 [Neocucurbitaria cava]|uniref:Secreted protein CSS2 C-terminal domain-containing protein n=1 Tax=Neocucurbitaria cava TaxID=798079 RepID=A0A9W8Y948_9PLEO|nr:hypothetical protein N0V83_004742 [Neocucurbitaria cava]
MRFQLLTVLACVLTASNALVVSEVNKPRENAEPETRDIAAPLEVRTGITTLAGAVAAGASTVSALAALTAYLAAHVKQQSDINSCSVVSGNADGANWQFQATTSGANCDTTSETKTLNDAITKQLKWMQSQKVDVACFTMKHGSGTWTGNLRISLDGKPVASGSQCYAAAYVEI